MWSGLVSVMVMHEKVWTFGLQKEFHCWRGILSTEKRSGSVIVSTEEVQFIKIKGVAGKP